MGKKKNIVATSKALQYKDDSLSLKSPRTVEACKRQGYLLKDLEFVSFENFQKANKDPSLEQSVLKVRWSALEQMRREKVKNVMKERQIVSHDSGEYRNKEEKLEKSRNRSQKNLK